MSTPDNRDSPQWHGGTLGDRFADAGHAFRDGSGGGGNGGSGGRHPAGRSCGRTALQLGVAGLLAVMLLAAPFLPRRAR